jgi:hypothetical protein
MVTVLLNNVDKSVNLTKTTLMLLKSLFYFFKFQISVGGMIGLVSR